MGKGPLRGRCAAEVNDKRLHLSATSAPLSEPRRSKQTVGHPACGAYPHMANELVRDVGCAEGGCYYYGLRLLQLSHANDDSNHRMRIQHLR